MPGQRDDPPIPLSSPDLIPNEDGSYQCDMCHQKVRVGDGGAKNFKQHWGSLVCLKTATKNRSHTNQAGNNMKTITSFFSKVTPSLKKAVALKGAPQSQSTQPACPTPNPPQPSLLLPTPSHELTMQGSLSAGIKIHGHPDAYALVLLARLDCAAQELPKHIPEAEPHDNIACVLSVGSPDDPREAWEYLDPVLNNLLGYSSSVEDVARRVRRGPLGVEGLGWLIHRFVVDYGITGDLLEGKIGKLLEAIELLIKG
jgi:hypothetical protein